MWVASGFRFSAKQTFCVPIYQKRTLCVPSFKMESLSHTHTDITRGWVVEYQPLHLQPKERRHTSILKKRARDRKEKWDNRCVWGNGSIFVIIASNESAPFVFIQRRVVSEKLPQALVI